jgi:hypothetical protein
MTATHAARPHRRRALLLLSGIVGLSTGCNTFNFLHSQPDPKKEPVTPPPPPPGAPSKYSFRLAPYIFIHDFQVDQNHAVFKELAGLRDQVYHELKLPPGTLSIQVYLFENKERYQAFMQKQYPELPDRRAFFLGDKRIGELTVYTYWGDRIRQDLRHELTHGLLHSTLKDVPLWLDEGLAEYFELPPEQQGVNPDHVRRLRAGAPPLFKPDLPRLEHLTHVKDMSPAEYREAWAWVHLMLRDSPETKKVLLDYLQQFRTATTAPPLATFLVKVVPVPEDELVRHLEQIDLSRIASTTKP